MSKYWQKNVWLLTADRGSRENAPNPATFINPNHSHHSYQYSYKNGVVHIQNRDISDPISAIAEKLERIERKLDNSQQLFLFFDAALEAYRKSHFRNTAAPQKILSHVTKDRELGWPHFKLVQCLAEQFCFDKGEFNELCFSKLVRAARVGKLSAKSHLNVLERKQLVESRNDGYRKWYSIGQRALVKPE